MVRLASAVVVALVAILAAVPAVGDADAAPPTTPPAAPTTPRPDSSPPRTTQQEGRPGRTSVSTTTLAGPVSAGRGGDESWSVQRIAITGAVAIAALALVGWAVARVRNGLARPRIK